MKPEISTAVMIERIRELATDSADSQDRVLFTQAANRIELLLAAESGMSREMACIRHALDIPPDQSVQSGVVDAFVRLNAEILELRNQLAELRGQEPADFRWRHRADDHSGASAWIYLPCDRADDFIKRIADKDKSIEYGYVFSRPVPPAASQPAARCWCPDVDPITGLKLFLWINHPTLGYVPTYGGPFDSYTLTERDVNGEFCRHRYDHDEGAWVDDEAVYLDELEEASQPYTVPDERAAYETFIAKRLGDSIDTQRAKNGDPEKPDYMAWDMTVGWIAWQGRAAMPQHGTFIDEGTIHSGDVANKVNSPVIPDGWVLVPAKANAAMISAAGRAAREYMEEYGGNSPQVIYQAMLAVAPKLDRKDGDTVSPDTSAVPDGYALVSIDLLNKFPEINICNYNHDDVGELNSWGIELVSSTDQKPISKDGDA
ncbi:hypothetical protein [Pectobacterium carotovorum]|uniref:hypothetical protein n=1 Tax=Pectobacterium carotovorum TaxID=554 RepID=UPI0037F681B6